MDGEDTKGNQRKWSKEAKKNSEYQRGGAATGVARVDEFNRLKRK